MAPAEKEGHGTEIILTIKPSTEEENYDEYLESYRIQQLVKKYSDYIRYPIRMQVEKSHPKEGAEGEYETYTEEETLNSMVPLWEKNGKVRSPQRNITPFIRRNSLILKTLCGSSTAIPRGPLPTMPSSSSPPMHLLIIIAKNMKRAYSSMQAA